MTTVLAIVIAWSSGSGWWWWECSRCRWLIRHFVKLVNYRNLSNVCTVQQSTRQVKSRLGNGEKACGRKVLRIMYVNGRRKDANL